MTHRFIRKSPNGSTPEARKKQVAFTMELLYDTSLVTAAVFVFALIISCGG